VAIFSQVDSGQNLVVLGKIALAEIQSNPVKSISTEILSSRPWPKFGHVVPDQNSFESHPSSSRAEIWPHWPRQKSVKFYVVSPMDTSLKKFNLNLFYQKWILDFELDPNI